MRIKNFTLMLMAVLFSVAGFAQKSFTPRNDVAINRQTTIQKMVKQNGISAIAVNQPSAPSHSAKAPAKAPEVVTPPEKGDVEYYTLTGSATYGNTTTDVSRQVKVVWDDEDEDVVYISGLSYYMPSSFVKGTFNKEGDKVTFSSGQYVGNPGVDLYFCGFDGKEIVDAVADFDEKESTFTFSVYLLDNGDPKELGFYAYFAPGVTIVPLENPDIPVEIPKDLEIEKYAYTAIDYFSGNVEVSGNLNVGIYGEDVYIQGMSNDAPQAWIKGTFENDTTVVFPGGQLLEEGLYFNVIGDAGAAEYYTLIYDPKTGVFTEDYEEPVISDVKNAWPNGLYQYYYGYVIKPITEQPATPAKSVVSAVAFMQTGDNLEFNLAKVDTDGEGLVAEKLTYKLWYATADGTEAAYTFTKDLYTSLEEDTDEIPATLTDGAAFADGSLALLMEGHDAWVSVGIQGIYYGGEERHESEIAWYTPTWPVTVTLPEGATVTEHTFKVEQYKSSGNVDVEKTVGLAIVGDDLYIRGIGDANENAWIKGTKNSEGNYVFAKGQSLGNYSTYYRLFFVGFDSDGNASDVTVSVNAADGVYEFAEEFRENATYTDKSYYLNRFLAGATISITEAVEEVPEVVEVPEGLETETWSFTATDHFDNTAVARSVSVGFDDEDVYVQGLSEVLPDAWVKGLVEEGSITFPAGQYLGQYSGYDIWFLGWNTSSSAVLDYVMEYDAENGVMTNANTSESLGINIYKNRISGSLFESYDITTIKKVVEKEATPATPSVDHMAFSAYGDFVEFSIPAVDVDGDGLVTDKLSYKLYYDEGDGEAKEVTFVADPELYEYLTEDMTVIPYGFIDGVDEEDGSTFAFDFDLGKVYLNMDHDTWTRVGIQSIYTGGGVTNASEIGWYTITWPQEIELPEGAEVVTYSFSGTTYTRNGNVDFSRTVNVAKVGDDVYVQGIGTRDEETWIKGTKNAETGVYNFRKGQYLGLYVSADQTDYSNLYLMGYSDMLGALDVKMSYDAESDIFTTTTELIENADYVDKLYYLTRINAGAQIKPIPNVAAVPAQPSVDDMAYSPVGAFIDFTITAEDAEGNAVIDSLLSYKLYYKDAEGVQNEVTFTTDLYTEIEADMTEVPYGFTEEYDFYDGRVYLNMDISGWTAIGIQSIYAGGDEINSSEISWYEVIKPQVVSLPDGVEALDYEFQGTNYDTRAGYVIGGVKVAFVEDDIYIKGISTVNSEAWIKGTKDENGNYVFAFGQFLGQTQDSRGRDVFAFLVGFDDSVELTEFMMSYDEETGIFTTLTYMIENSNFVDAMNYLSAFLSGARLLPASHPDAIDTVEAADDEKAATFNIAGQRVGKNYKGIVVKAGRKVLQK